MKICISYLLKIYKKIIKAILFYSGIIELLHYLITSKAKLAIILRYHSIADFNKDNVYASQDITVRVKDFDKQIRYLSKRYKIIPLEELVLCIKNGKDIPQNSLVITFDDGYRDNYLNAYPILKKYGAHATFFITAGCIDNEEMLWTQKIFYILNLMKDKRINILNQQFELDDNKSKIKVANKIISMLKEIDQHQKDKLIEDLTKKLNLNIDNWKTDLMLSWEEVGELERFGFSIGSHTLTHPNLPNSDTKLAKFELRESKLLIERMLNRPIKLFSYPNGGAKNHFNEKIKKIVKECGFIGAVTSVDGVIDKKVDIYELSRKGVSHNTKLYELSTALVINKLMKMYKKD